MAYERMRQLESRIGEIEKRQRQFTEAVTSRLRDVEGASRQQSDQQKELANLLLELTAHGNAFPAAAAAAAAETGTCGEDPDGSSGRRGSKQGAPAPPGEHGAGGKEPRFCYNCGSGRVHSARFCQMCGVTFGPSPDAAYDPAPANQRHSWTYSKAG
ncbi:hypothetical protein DIPPA_34935 [Diplonema papillatum]|nr:hypothetical protein DIPPA_34935 [Diplonema papillatum]